MARCELREGFLRKRCKEEIPIEEGNYCLKHGCSYLCKFKNRATQKTSFGKNVCDKCFDLAKKENEFTLEEKRKKTREERQREFQNSNDKIIAAIKNASPNFWKAIEKTFEILSEQKKLLIEDVGKWGIYGKFIAGYGIFIDNYSSLLTDGDREKWKKVYGLISSYDNFLSFLQKEKEVLVSSAQRWKIKETEEEERERERETN